VLKVLQIDTLQDWQFHCPGLLRIPRFSHCCPNLQQLQSGAPLSTCVDLTPMTQLQQLTELLLLTLLDKSMAASLASLTGLKKLTLHTWQLPDEALLQLTALTGLHHHHHHHHHHQITKLSHSINAIGPAPHRA
jgi:hypothetical protein